MLNINTGVFQNELVRDSIEAINRVGSRKKLGLKRWDNILDVYPFSGTVRVPIKVGYRVFEIPFYFIIEKVNDKESLRVKPIEGDQYQIGDVYGFFGLSGFESYRYGMPIMLTEGTSDWGFCKTRYIYTLTTLTAGVSYKQAFFLSNLTNFVVLGYDNDETGVKDKSAKLLRSLGVKVLEIHPPRKDWGAAFDSDYSWEKSIQVMDQIVGVCNKVNNVILTHN